jgi:lipopolysaccharide export system protein LptA
MPSMMSALPSPPFGHCVRLFQARIRLGVLILACGLWATAPTAMAEKADRGKPWVIEGDRDATMDEQRRTVVIAGNAAITQGSMALRAERIEVQEQGGVVRQAVALGSAPKWATFRQKRDVPNEHVEAQAQRIEYDGPTDTVRFLGQAVLRIVRGTVVVHEVSGSVLSWDNKREQFSAKGAPPGDGSGSGRFQWIMTPASAPTGTPPGERK